MASRRNTPSYFRILEEDDDRHLPSLGSPDCKYYKASRHRSNQHYAMLSLVLFSWLSYLLSGSTDHMLQKLGYEESLERIHVAEAMDELTEMKNAKMQATTYLKKIKKTRDAFKHELKMIQELKEDGERVTPVPKGNERLMTNWVNRRMGILETKVSKLQSYIKSESKKELIAKYGEGPHRAKFTVEFVDRRKKLKAREFTVELASIDEMPHADLFFLEMTSKGIWNDTVFLHHEQLEHLLAAAPVDFEKQSMKFHNLLSINWDNLAFPEYSSKYPHEKFSVGFAAIGPTFYINTYDNSEAHGPNSQGHHPIPGDADPCFGKIIEGQEHVEEMIAAGAYQLKMNKDSVSPYAEKDHSMTHIISIELLKD